jgi:hypothetical protein|tara:strand:- start:311 stop:586 length:276 start_codon:yes stop_codon:yes gene_type:complete
MINEWSIQQEYNKISLKTYFGAHCRRSRIATVVVAAVAVVVPHGEGTVVRLDFIRARIVPRCRAIERVVEVRAVAIRVFNRFPPLGYKYNN